MLFNSPEFIFGFVPLTLLGFFLLARHSHSLALTWLTGASLVFDGGWNPQGLPTVPDSAVLNEAGIQRLKTLYAGQAQRFLVLATHSQHLIGCSFNTLCHWNAGCQKAHSVRLAQALSALAIPESAPLPAPP